MSARKLEPLPSCLSDTDSNKEKFKSVCEGNSNSGNGSANKPWFSRENGDAKREKRFPGEVTKEVTSMSTPIVLRPESRPKLHLPPSTW